MKYLNRHSAWQLYVCRDVITGLVYVFDSFEDFSRS